MERIAWSLIRSQLKSELATELRICLEALWALPGSETPFDVVLLPSNVFVGVDGTVELRVPRPADQRYFRRYLAPELGAGKPATVASAIYSVGALLFEVVSGSPFEASESVEREVGYLAARAQATGLSRDLTDTELLEVVLKATRARPEERWGSAESFSRELDQVARHRTATREELAWLVTRWVSRSTPAGVRPGLDPTEWNRADVLPLPFVPSDAEAIGPQLSVRAASSFGTPGQLRSTTLRGFSLDLSSYPPPRPALEAAVDAPTAGSPQGVPAPNLLDRDAEPSPQPRPPSADANLEAPLPAPALAPRQFVFVPAPFHDVPRVGAEPAFASSDAAQTADPLSGVRVRASAAGLPSDRRLAALITALVVALPLVGMTFWNWRASARAANQDAPSVQQVPSVSVEASLQRAEEPRERDAAAKPHASVTVAPVSDLAKVPAEPKRAKRQPLPKQRGPDDYGI